MAQASHLQMIDEKDLRDVVLVRTSVGACLRGHFGRTGHKVAVKLIKDSKWIDRLKKEGMLGKVCSEQVLVPLGVYTTRSLVGLVWDWMTEGSLDSLLHETDMFQELSMALCLRILLDVSKGLAHLHAIPLPHGALKATNVLLDQQYRAKLCDWGQEIDMHLTTSDGRGPCYRDLAYVSPEVIQGAVPSVEADIYSCGVLLWETLNRKRPCEGIDQLQTKLGLGLEVDLLPPMTPQSHALTQLTIRCLNSEPQKRPSAKECVEVLRTTLAVFEPQIFTEAVHLKTCKERRLPSCKMRSSWELPIELHNLEVNSCKSTTKNLTSKVIPQNETLPQSSLNAKEKAPLPMATRGCRQIGCCRDTGKSSVQSNNSCNDHGFTQINGSPRVPQRQSSTSLRFPCVSPTTIFQNNPQHNAGNQGRSCCRLLQERREVIVRCMTEGRLNNLLDVLRARQAVTREMYEIITAALTLTTRTRCLLDVCACLGENVAILVATTLGLVSTENTQTTHRWQAG
ncbi:receptor-interacting serine/threonine-protein kinase 2-like isoform X2 [Sinocyclocheilus rhinocerous]|uniref:receptor-interacting serine/threonine-protein kinase 2-like isoform X2 n=1 Tax=Sinocyclocheilus rhinocerous TaxID=307959 RepID=UPI0007B93321|nr:PREDICTED: receptor-interacting serine/threonine-protein kinase 2-like isoform X2 [Sinocyclocheilus rhinocerous]